MISRTQLAIARYIGIRSLNGTKRYPLIGDDPAEPKKLEVFIKQDENGKDIYVDAEGKRLFTQDHMNAEIGNARKKATETNKTLIAQLEDLQAQASTSEAMKDELQQQIENLQQASLSKEEKLALQIKSLETNLSKTQEKMTAERDRAVKLWRDERIANELRAASDMHKAHSFEQIQGLLSSRTQLKEIIGDDGKPTGKHEVLVELDITDKDGNVTKAELAPIDALKEMKGMTDRYGNLFVSPEKGGMGSGNGDGGNTILSATPPPEVLKDPAKYRAWKETNMPASK